MENIKKIKKYGITIQAVLFVIAFALTLPASALAWEDYSYNYSSDYSYTPPTDYSYTPATDYQYDYSDSNTTSVGSSNSYSYNGYYGGGYYQYPYYSGSGQVGYGYTAPTATYTTYTPATSIVYDYTNSNSGYSYYPSYNPLYGSYYSQPYSYYYSQPAVSNQVLSYTDTNPSVDSVYLSDVPYTGFSDYYGILIFVSILLSWSTILAYVFLKRKIESQKVLASVGVEKIETNKSNDSVTSDFINQMASDNSDIDKVETYARSKKVLLSSDASAKLVKLSRLGKIDVSEYIQGIAKGEWIAVGENEIK